MNMVYKGFGMLKYMYNQLNPATLTGAIDILVVEQPDGSLVASPFHVRFGKLGVLRAREKLVNIAINGERVKDLHMKLGDQGEAFFVEKIDEEEAIPLRLMTSPLPSRPSTPTKDDSNNFGESVFSESGKRRRRKKRKRKSIVPPNTSSGAGSNSCSDEEEKLDVGAQESETLAEPLDANRTSSQSSADYRDPVGCVPKLRVSMYDSDASDCSVEISGSWEDSPDENRNNFSEIRCVQSDSEVANLDELRGVIESPFSDSEASCNRQGSGMMWGWGQLPATNDRSRESSTSSSTSSDDVETQKIVDQVELDFRNVVHIENEVTKSELAKDETTSESKPTENPPTRVRKDTEGLYLDDVLSLEPSEANLYLQGGPKELPTSPDINELPTSASDIDSGTDSQTHDDQAFVSTFNEEVSMSLCGIPSGSAAVQPEKFQEKLVTYENFMQNAMTIINDPNLVVKIGDHYLAWQHAAPVITAMAVFKKPVDMKCLERLIQPSTPALPQSGSRLMGWLWRRPSRNENTVVSQNDDNTPASTTSKQQDAPKSHTKVGKSFSASSAPRAPIAPRGRRQTEQTHNDHELSIIMEPELKRSQSVEDIYSHTSDDRDYLTTDSLLSPQGLKTMRKTTRLTHDQLSQLNLKPGANTITFSVTTQYQGTTRCVATAFKWKWCDKIVVSDIDGTITKSDVFGQILPVVGKDWTQGGVAQLYQNISKNGYKFIYLSSRAIGQASMTKDYLNWINQQGASLPPGPLLLSPTSLMIAFKREVIEKKPEKFKIECLKDIKALFPNNPFVAGFGNKTNDVCAYSAVGVPGNRMFTINHKGELKQEQLQTYTTTYSGLGDTVDHFFPPLDQDQGFDRAHEYSEFTYWREDILTFADELENFA
uniref:phosphatidate phosphatase LPIN1 isoform X1 n=1 Tax=Ciona intestinalis TaxID=7719 RepID=UPI00089DC314|nr:phosphatidate phosphatase LPIN1 isoform X1 [Ciona intestinalis]|eukprot:XP_018672987.1 phosphatidate phosphatase LPIN1 isoform X1 [Ciona intestinalis]